MNKVFRAFLWLLLMGVIALGYLLAVGFSYIATCGVGNCWWHPFEMLALVLLTIDFPNSRWQKISVISLCALAIMVAMCIYYSEGEQMTYLLVASWCLWAVLMVWVLHGYYHGLNNTTLLGCFFKDRALFRKRRQWCRWVEEYRDITTVPAGLIKIGGEDIAEYYRKRAGLPVDDPYYLEHRHYVCTGYSNPSTSEPDAPSSSNFQLGMSYLFYLFTHRN